MNYMMCILKLTSYLQLQDQVDYELYSLMEIGLHDVTAEVFKRHKLIDAKIRKVCNNHFDADGYRKRSLGTWKK